MPAISEIVRQVPLHWVGDGFPVRSLFTYRDAEAFDPFLLLDYAGPHRFEPTSDRRGVGEHPHRGFETVTIVYQGELEHRDSSGSRGTIGPGDVQWMTAASGVVHEEFHSEPFCREGGVLELVQLWVNLPAKDKMSAPRYQGLVRSQIPTIELPNGAGRGRVIAGELLGARGAARTCTPIHVWDLELNADATLELPLPEGHTSLLIVQSGAVDAAGQALREFELARCDRSGGAMPVRSLAPSRLLVLAGEPLGEPVVGEGPFVMNSREEIRQAFLDYRLGRMGRMEDLI